MCRRCADCIRRDGRDCGAGAGRRASPHWRSVDHGEHRCCRRKACGGLRAFDRYAREQRIPLAHCGKPAPALLPRAQRVGRSNPRVKCDGRHDIGLTSMSTRHESAHLHVSGQALYTDDIPLPSNTLHAAFGLSSIAHGRIRTLDLAPAQSFPGVFAVATAADVPGENNYGSVVHDDPIFAPGLVEYVGAPLFAVAADTYTTARKAARCAKIDYETLPAILDIHGALAAGATVVPTHRLVRGRPHEALVGAPHRLKGTVHIGGQDHFYLEGQVAIAVPQEDGAMLIHSSTQHPSEVQQIVARALAKQANQVTVQCRRMGGGFG